MTCPLRACRTCTGCAHSDHAACRRVVRCPDTAVERACECCGPMFHGNPQSGVHKGDSTETDNRASVPRNGKKNPRERANVPGATTTGPSGEM